MAHTDTLASALRDPSRDEAQRALAAFYAADPAGWRHALDALRLRCDPGPMLAAIERGRALIAGER